MVKHRYGPSHRGTVHRVAVAPSEDADSGLDAAEDGGEDAVQQGLLGSMQRLRNVLQYYKFEQRVANRLRGPGKVAYVVLLGALSKWKYAAQQNTSIVARGDPMEG